MPPRFRVFFSPAPIRAFRSTWRPGCVCFVCFSCASLNGDFLAVHACRHYAIWRRDAVEMGLETMFVTLESPKRNRSSCGGEREQRDFFQAICRPPSLFFPLFPSRVNRKRSLHSVARRFSPSVYLSRYYCIIERIFARIGSHRPRELCHAIPQLLIAIKRSGRLVSMKKCAIFSRRKGRACLSILYPRRVTSIQLTLSHFSCLTLIRGLS